MNKAETIIREDNFKLDTIKPISCSIWIGRACARLKDEGLMHFDDWEEIRREVLDFSNGHWNSGMVNEQSRPLGFSRVCGILN